MESYIVYVDDREHAERQILPMLGPVGSARWMLVACPPRLHRHAGRWVTRSALRRWRLEWTREQVQPLADHLARQGHDVSVRTAFGVLTEVTRQIQGDWGVARVLDARRPKLGVSLEPVSADQPTAQGPGPWTVTGSAVALGVAVAAAAD